MQVWLTQLEAWAPGLDTARAWRQFDPAHLPAGDDKPPAKAVPAMTRRRLTRWGRQALEVAEPACVGLYADAPIVFSSRHGDTGRTLKLLRDLAADNPLSPNAFSLSVHNSALGLLTILHEHRAPSLAIAGGRDTLAAAWKEAESWLADGAPQVLLVHTEEPLGDLYERFTDEREMPAALALVMRREPCEGAVGVTLTMSAPESAASEHSQMIAFLHWWFTERPSLTVSTDRHTWQWRRSLGH